MSREQEENKRRQKRGSQNFLNTYNVNIMHSHTQIKLNKLMRSERNTQTQSLPY